MAFNSKPIGKKTQYHFTLTDECIEAITSISAKYRITRSAVLESTFLGMMPSETKADDLLPTLFEMFSQEIPFPEIIVLTKADPTFVRKAYLEYKTGLDKPSPNDGVAALDRQKEIIEMELQSQEIQLSVKERIAAARSEATQKVEEMRLRRQQNRDETRAHLERLRLIQGELPDPKNET